MIQACLNGRRTRAEHPRIPLTPEELAREGKASVEAGAGALHVHPRGPDGFETMDAAHRAATLVALREACPGIEISFTTGLWITNDVKRRLELVASWTELPDVASVNIAEPGAVELIAALVGRRIAVEVGIASVGDAKALVKSGVASRCKRVLTEVEGSDTGTMVELAAIDTVLDAAGIEIPRLEHGYGRGTYAIIDRAVRLGRDYRIGFEDTMILPDGRPAKSNAELILACRARTEAR